MMIVLGWNQNFLQRIMIWTSFGDPLQAMWDRDRKIVWENVGKKGKPTGFIYVPGSKFREAEGYLLISSCLPDDVINSAPRIGKYIKNLNCTDSALLEEWNIQKYLR